MERPSITIIVLLLCALGIPLSAQEEQENIVPNPGFELFSATPLGWFYTGKDFTRVMKYWESPTAASPDVYGPNVYVPSEWKKQGFGETDARSGEAMAGITVYGCEGGKPHCREYIQIQLTEPLVPYQRYKITYWAKPLEGCYHIRTLAIAFTVNRNYSNVDERLMIRPDIVPGGFIANKRDDWLKIEAEMIAGAPAEYMVIGNFFDDETTQCERCESGTHLPFGYYYIDDISMVKMPPILDIPVEEDDLSKAVLETGRTITLNNIYFDYDSDEFVPRSFKELNTLVKILQENPQMRIEIRGHTDNKGNDEYNMTLSKSRAKAVVRYLTDNGIEDYRLDSWGFGSSQPVAANDTEEGRQENRRVEFLILSM